MRLRIKIEDIVSMVVDWDDALLSFPQVISYIGQKWEWVMYDTGTQGADYDLNYGKLPVYDPRHSTPAADLEALMRVKAPIVCECYATKMGHPGHSYWCPMDKRS
jgi:hypothetical protein